MIEQEKKVEKALVRMLSNLGCESYKFVSQNCRGVPDRLFITEEGRVFFAELKTIKGRLSSLQEIQIKKLKALKQEVYVIYGMDGVRKFVEDFQNNCLSGTEYR